MNKGLVALGLVLLSGCTDPKATAFDEALDCWGASELLAVAANHGSDAKLLGFGRETADEMRRHWNAESVKRGEQIGKSESQVNQQMWALFQGEGQRMRTEPESSADGSIKKLVERNKICLKRFRAR